LIKVKNTLSNFVAKSRQTALLSPTRRRFLTAGVVLLFVSACGGKERRPDNDRFTGQVTDLPPTDQGREVVLFALSLLDIGYHFGGRNPEAGFDCSGMVIYIFAQSVGIVLSGSAADIARRGTKIDRTQLRPGDLVFFNTRKKHFSHVGIYIGDNHFIHAPSTNGKVRIDDLGSRYYAERYEAARTYFQ